MNFTSEQLRFASIPGHTARADFAGGGLSSDLGPLLLHGVDRQIGLTERLNAAVIDNRHPSYITRSQRDLLTQRIYQIGCSYEDGNDLTREFALLLLALVSRLAGFPLRFDSPSDLPECLLLASAGSD